jgi:hypothetical protein
MFGTVCKLTVACETIGSDYTPECIHIVFCNSLDGRGPADLHMAQPHVPVSETGHIPPARLVFCNSLDGRLTSIV